MVFETKDQIIRRKKKARFKFRFLVRKALFNKTWLSEIDEPLGEDVKRNVAIILKRSHRKGALTIIEKRILKKTSESRSEEENEKLQKLFETLPCFSSFTPAVRKKLISAVEFFYFPKNKILYMENHICQSMFFILVGEILVTKLTFNHIDNETIDEPVNLIGPGEFFGHLGLLYNTERNATCKTQTDCELLLLYKEDFDEILKDTLAERYDNIQTALERFEYFKNYTDAKIKECCVISKIEQYNPQDVIYSQQDISNFSYFVLSGKAMILQCLKIREKSNGKCELIVQKKKANPLEMAINKSYTNVTSDRITSLIAPNDSGEDEAGVKYQFVDVGTFRVGAVFGITEDIENRVIIARTMVQCLLIPRQWLFQKAQNIGNVWQRIKLFLNSSIPSQEKLFREYLMNQRWKKYKKKTIQGILQHYNIREPETQYHNIPVICRIQNQ